MRFPPTLPRWFGFLRFVYSPLVVVCLTGFVQTTSVSDNCFPSDATVTGTISGDFFVGFAHKKDPETHKNPTNPTPAATVQSCSAYAT